MQQLPKNTVSRRSFLKNTGRVAAATTLVASMVPHVHAAENHTLQIALIGCGGRGSGAVGDAMAVTNGPVKLVAMADVFEHQVSNSFRNLKRQFGDGIDVPQDRRFVGFDAYQKAMDCLRPGDIAIFATPLAFRWVHFAYAIQKGLNVFMEKPLTADGPTSRKMFKLAEQATAKNVKVGVGLMSRHSRGMQDLAQRIHDGEIGDLVLLRGYRMHGAFGDLQSTGKPAGISEVAYQVRRFHSFLWASGGCFSDLYIHIIDHCCWMKNAWPIEAQALGGRHYRGESVDQNFDTYSVEYTFADETRFIMDGRCIGGCEPIYNSFAHGTKGTAVLARANDCDGPSATFKGLASSPADWANASHGHSGPSAAFKGRGSKPANMLWQSKDGSSPYRNEWNDLVNAIRNDKPYNEVKRGVEASLVTSMGRMAAHTGQVITYDQILNGSHEFAPDR